jgi:hypothetical protein
MILKTTARFYAYLGARPTPTRVSGAPLIFSRQLTAARRDPPLTVLGEVSLVLRPPYFVGVQPALVAVLAQVVPLGPWATPFPFLVFDLPPLVV